MVRRCSTSPLTYRGKIDAWPILVDLAHLNVLVLPAKKAESWVFLGGVAPVDPQWAQLDLTVIGMDVDLGHDAV